MSEKSENAAENLMNNIIDTVSDAVSKQKTVRFNTGEEPLSGQVNKLLGRQKSVHHVLGGGKSADVLLWRNKKISSSVLGAATALWVVFEWLDYHFLTLVAFILVLGMVVQFLWSNASGLLSSSREVPRVKLPEELFVNIGVAVGGQVNKFLDLIQEISCGGNLKQFLIVVLSLWAAAVIGSWCNLLTVIYIGFVCAHTLPVLYEKYQDQVDNFLAGVLGLLTSQYQKLDQSVLSKIPKGNLKSRKAE
ncbi:Reticulon-like protein [Rhynchospora pubera]|uniref:Reticulon-like protein n=1 Tax=Rhynchospora pubera TaxID=906938 RepID=A0AAV8G4L5_9POAL|nr:Reticulon-like protein [Rhynchospora pubera]KAJ4800039.1 Reticulon-like protein [Rhynchospora pubera]KAJ4811419.1 Reticulon-like protein [Rhynchospora pubera]